MVPQAFAVCLARVAGRRACSSQLHKVIFNVSDLRSLNPLVGRPRAHFYVDRHMYDHPSHIYLPFRSNYFYPSSIWRHVQVSVKLYLCIRKVIRQR